MRFLATHVWQHRHHTSRPSAPNQALQIITDVCSDWRVTAHVPLALETPGEGQEGWHDRERQDFQHYLLLAEYSLTQLEHACFTRVQQTYKAALDCFYKVDLTRTNLARLAPSSTSTGQQERHMPSAPSQPELWSLPPPGQGSPALLSAFHLSGLCRQMNQEKHSGKVLVCGIWYRILPTRTKVLLNVVLIYAQK